MIFALVLLAALAFAAVSYADLRRLGRRALVPAACRAVAWVCLGLLLLNPGCPVPPDLARPLVLLDGSLSMEAAGGRWTEALSAARAAGEVRLFGDPDAHLDSVPGAGRSDLAPALAAARATGRPVIVMSDGEIGDSAEATRELAGVAVKVFPRARGPSLALIAVRGPARVTERDTIHVAVDVRAAGLSPDAATALVVRNGGRAVATMPIKVSQGVSTADVPVAAKALGAGDHLLEVALRDSLDVERRDDRRLLLVSVSATPGVVLVASPGDWDARFLFKVLRQVTNLPVEGYVELVPNQWKRMSSLAPIDPTEVRQSVARADLVVLRGGADLLSSARGRAVLEWPSAAGNDETLEGDWYLATAEGPAAAALAGAAVDSFAPMAALLPLGPDSGAWIGLTAQLGKRGALRPALAGSVREGRRRVVIGAQGLWRWAFRGGSSEQAYRALVAGTVDWLLAGQDTARGRAIPVRPVVPNARPIAFQWTGAGPAASVPIRLRRSDGKEQSDTLTFDGAGRAQLHLPVGVYTYQLAGGGRGSVAVEEYSDEWFPRPVALKDAGARPAATDRHQGIRERWWLFLLAILALCGEWVARRRMGLR